MEKNNKELLEACIDQLYYYTDSYGHPNGQTKQEMFINIIQSITEIIFREE